MMARLYLHYITSMAQAQAPTLMQAGICYLTLMTCITSEQASLSVPAEMQCMGLSHHERLPGSSRDSERTPSRHL